MFPHSVCTIKYQFNDFNFNFTHSIIKKFAIPSFSHLSSLNPLSALTSNANAWSAPAPISSWPPMNPWANAYPVAESLPSWPAIPESAVSYKSAYGGYESAWPSVSSAAIEAPAYSSYPAPQLSQVSYQDSSKTISTGSGYSSGAQDGYGSGQVQQQQQQQEPVEQKQSAGGY